MERESIFKRKLVSLTIVKKIFELTLVINSAAYFKWFLMHANTNVLSTAETQTHSLPSKVRDAPLSAISWKPSEILSRITSQLSHPPLDGANAL